MSSPRFLQRTRPGSLQGVLPAPAVAVHLLRDRLRRPGQRRLRQAEDAAGPGALGFSESVFGFGMGIFFVGYLLLEIPGTLLVEKWSARKWISRIMISWGISRP